MKMGFSGFESVDLFRPCPLSVGGSRIFPFAESLWKHNPHLVGVPFPLVCGGVALSMPVSQKMGRSPNLKKIKNKILEKIRFSRSVYPRRLRILPLFDSGCLVVFVNLHENKIRDNSGEKNLCIEPSFPIPIPAQEITQ